MPLCTWRLTWIRIRRPEDRTRSPFEFTCADLVSVADQGQFTQPIFQSLKIDGFNGEAIGSVVKSVLDLFGFTTA